MTQIATFNVGGVVHQLSRSLLDQHPETLLARSASKIWQEDPTSEIFMERDGEMFRYVLNYLRDGKVVLPVTVSREAVLQEFDYYCINVEDNTETISVTKCNHPAETINTVFNHMKRRRDELEADEDRMTKKLKLMSLSKLCIDKWMMEGVQGTEKVTLDVDACTVSSQGLLENYHEAVISCNEHLNKLGLEISSIKRTSSSQNRLKVNVNTMRKVRKIEVSGAGTEAVNGVYTFSHERKDPAGSVLFTRKGLWEGKEEIFALFQSCCKKNGAFKWCISIIDGAAYHRKVKFYASTELVTNCENPTNLSWKRIKEGSGTSPVPTVIPFNGNGTEDTEV